jgi:hypothetical protein
MNLKKRFVLLFIVLFMLSLGVFYALLYGAHFTGFEAGVSGWTFGGGDGARNTDTSYCTDTSCVGGGSYSANIKDDSATSYIQQTFDLSTLCDGAACKEVNISFWAFYETVIDATEELDLKCDGTTIWSCYPQDGDDPADDSSQCAGTGNENTWKSHEISLNNPEFGSCVVDGSVVIRFESEFSQNGEESWVDGINITGYPYPSPELDNITSSHTNIKGGDLITLYANTSEHGVNDSEQGSVSLYCSNSTTSPSSSDNICSDTDATYPYVLSCSYNVETVDEDETVFCRAYNGFAYSTSVNQTYTIDSSAPSLIIASVAGDAVAGYFDSVNDALTEVIVNGEASMVCRWSNSDVAYSSMSDSCLISGSQANCSIDDVGSQGSFTRHVSCQDSFGNENIAGDNLDVGFSLDYTAPTTSDNSDSNVYAPNYVVTLTENDNVDADPTSYYCTDVTVGCNPITGIDNGGTITYTSSNRGTNYLRYYSVDDAGNSQIVVNKTININQLPVFLHGWDDSVIIGPSSVVNISANFSEVDTGQEVSLWVCDSQDVSVAGCGGNEYCNITSDTNTSCNFSSSASGGTYNWYSFIYDELNEMAIANFSGNYTVDADGPTISIVSPANTTYSQDSVTAEITTSEAASWAGYNLDNNSSANVSMSNTSATGWTAIISGLSLGSHNLTFYANDSYNNIGISTIRYFSISSPSDTTSPAITIHSPANASYQEADSLLINISADEDLAWAGYQLNAGAIIDLDNYSLINWNKTINGLNQETTYNLTIYANDSSNNPNNKTYVIYVDSLFPRYSSAQASPSPANVSQAVNCSISWTDGYNLTNIKISENSAGFHENHTISFSEISGSVSYNIVGSKLDDPGTYACIFYAEDAAGNSNTTFVNFNVNDVISPVITVTSPNNATYNQESIDLSLVVSEAASWAGYSLDGAVNVTMGNISATNWNSTISVSNGNSYTVKFYANDSSGNMANSSEITFSIDTGGSDSVAPVITINTIANASYKLSSSVELNITINENSTWAGYVLNGGSLTSMSNSSIIKWNTTLSGLGVESTNTLEVYANDSSNNKGNQNITFYVDALVPRILNISATPDPANETQNVICNAYVNDTFSLTSVKIGENASNPGIWENHTLDLTSSGWMNYTILNVEKGDYSCEFFVTDAAGNVNNTESTTFTVNDVTSPVITIYSPLNQTYDTDSILFSISLNEDAVSPVNYSINGAANVSLSGSGTDWSDTVVLTDGTKTVEFFATDSSGNNATNSITFYVDTSVTDVSSPFITIWSPVNNSYDIDGNVLLNITTNENLAWAGWQNNSESFNDLGNVSAMSWNSTVSFAEGQHNPTIYANDSANNQASKGVVIYVDLTNPSIDDLSCTDVNDSIDVICYGNVSDVIGLDYVIISYNSSGSFQNSSQISLSGVSSSFNYTIASEDTAPGNFVAYAYLYDQSGRSNLTESDQVLISDDTFPTIWNITYAPNTTDLLDPYTRVDVNATIIEDYGFGDIYLMYSNQSSGEWSLVSMTNLSAKIANTSVVYNASFIPGNETWFIKINATDSSGNQNISRNYSLIVTNDTSQFISTTVPAIKSLTYAQRTGNNSLGEVYMNNTGDASYDFNVSLVSSSIGERLSINYTQNQSYNFTGIGKGGIINISIDVNTTDLTTGLYDYNITIVSGVNTSVYQKKLNIQTSNGPYLIVSIDTYSSSVTRGQEDVELVASVTNLGTQDATDVSLNWSLPSGFSLSTGNLSRSFSNLPIGVSATNTITIDIGSSITSDSLNISVNANSSNADPASDNKSITITDPLTETVTVTTSTSSGGSGGGGGAGGGAGAIIYDKIIEIVRGKEDSFEIEVYNKNPVYKLQGLSLDLTGFLEQYFEVFPDKISKVNPEETRSFTIKLNAPAYMDYEEHHLKAVISGQINKNGSLNTYSEIQNILLIIQEVSRVDANESLQEAEKAISEMNEFGFEITNVEELLIQGNLELNQRRNKQADDLAKEIILIKEQAFETNKLITRLLKAVEDPRKTYLLVSGFAIAETDLKDSINLLVNDGALFASPEAVESLNLAIAAFERGDYATALERAKFVQSMLILERKGDIVLFFYLYWHYILISFVVIASILIFSFRKTQKALITKRIKDLNKEEQTIQILMVKSQKEYFNAKLSVDDYHGLVNQNQKRLIVIKKQRLNLRNKRIKLLKPEQILIDLENEKKEVESEVKLIQTSFYKNKKISESNYKLQFESLNQRLAEIEEDRAVIHLMQKKKHKVSRRIKRASKLNYQKNKKKQKFKGKYIRFSYNKNSNVKNKQKPGLKK